MKRSLVGQIGQNVFHSTKPEGIVFPPLPLTPRLAPRPGVVQVAALRESGAPPCEMCGHPVIAAHCKRVCLHCGFLTGCSEGI